MSTLPVPPPPPPPAKKSGSGVVLVIVIIVVICLAGVGYWLLRRSKSAIPANAGSAGSPSASATALKVEVPLVKAIEEGRVDDAKQLLDKGSDVNAANSDGTTALMQAAPAVFRNAVPFPSPPMAATQAGMIMGTAS